MARSAADLAALASLTQEGLAQAHRLVLALNHELGNVMAGLRLQAFLLADDPTPRALAATSLELDDLCAKACALLTLARALLAPASPATGNPAVVLAAL